MTAPFASIVALIAILACEAGNSWVCSWGPAVWNYSIDSAAGVVEAGFGEVRFGYTGAAAARRRVAPPDWSGGAGR